MAEFLSCSEADTIRWAKKYIKNLSKPIICLDGAMGAGKTAIVRGFAAGLGINEPVTSPTFTIINEYFGDSPLYHFDLYRLTGIDELYYLGFDEYLSKDGVKVFEWGSKFDVFNEIAYHINIEIVDYKTRKIYFPDGTITT